MKYVKQRWARDSSFCLASLKISNGMILTTTTTGQCFKISICEIPSLPLEVVKSMLSLIISSISYSPASSSLASDNSSRQNVETVINPKENKETSTTEWNEWIEDLNNQLLSSPPPSPKKSVPPPPTRKKQAPPSSTTYVIICSSPIIILLSRKLLLDTAAAIDEGGKETATAYLDILRRTRNPHLTVMMILALSEHIKPTRRPIADLCSSEQKGVINILCSISHLFQLSLMAANHAIVEATLDDTIIHIINFVPGKGSQLANIINLLAGHHKSPLVIKITIVCNPTSIISRLNNGEGGNMLENVQQRLIRVVERLEGVKLQFKIVNMRAREINEATLGCEPGEALVVNFSFQLSQVADEGVSIRNPRDEILWRVRALGPRVVTLVEQNVNFNTASFAERFSMAQWHYGAMLESWETTRTSSENSYRVLKQIEESLSQRAINVLAWEGNQRVERCEVFDKWRARMGLAGLRPTPLEGKVIERVVAKLPKCNQGFTVKEEEGGLCFGWREQEIIFASAWH